MYFECECGTQVHLNTNTSANDLPINLMCIKCFKKEKLDLYIVEYDIPPLRLIHWLKVLAKNSNDAKEIVGISNPQIRIRDCIVDNEV